MAFSMSGISIIFFSLLGVVIVVRCQWEIDRDDNIEPFALLCRIYNVAKNPPINHVDLVEPHKIVKEIDALNASLVDEKRYNETEVVENGGEAKINSAATKESVVAQLSLNQITQRAHKILEDIKRMNVSKEIGKVKDEFHKVIFGEDGNESDLDQGALKGVDGRAGACGNNGLSSKGTSAGKNLVVDFFCLCAQRQDGKGAKQVCGFYVGSIYENGILGWNESHPIGSSTMWASIKGGCGKHMQQHPRSTAEARHVLDQFLNHLKTGGVYRWTDSNAKNVEGSDRKEGMLGTGVGKDAGNNENGPVCNGKNGKNWKSSTAPAGVCVYYGQESEWKNIQWVIKYESAVAAVDYANNQAATMQREIKKLQMLLHRAEEIYETSKVITEIQHPVVPTAFQNASGNLTAFNATRTRSYSYSPHPYFIPLWVLFFI